MDLLTTAFVGNINKNSPLRNVHKYIFPTQCNTLHSKNSKIQMSETRLKTEFERNNKKENDEKKMENMRCSCLFKVIIL